MNFIDSMNPPQAQTSVHVLTGTDRHRQHGEGTTIPAGTYRLAQSASEDKDMHLIVGGGAAILLLMFTMSSWMPYVTRIFG